MSVAIGWDDLWIEVICQSNLEIAGSPRKVFRHRAPPHMLGVKLLDGLAKVTELTQPNSEY